MGGGGGGGGWTGVRGRKGVAEGEVRKGDRQKIGEDIK